MRQNARDRASLAEPNGSAGPELLDAVPTTGPERTANGWLWLASRGLGALALLATGAVHLHLYTGLYSGISTIGTLFVLNFVGATALALALLAPLERIGGRQGTALLALAVSAGIALAVVSFAFLLISERTPLFGFMEPGYDPPAIAASRAAEVATVVFLGVFLAGRVGLKSPMRRW
jgi:hypothetical protein